MTGYYADILTVPRPISHRHAPMAPLQRAAQFAPFAALNGYEEAIEQTAQATVDAYNKHISDCDDCLPAEFP